MLFILAHELLSSNTHDMFAKDAVGYHETGIVLRVFSVCSIPTAYYCNCYTFVSFYLTCEARSEARTERKSWNLFLIDLKNDTTYL